MLPNENSLSHPRFATQYCDATGDVCGIEIKDFIFDLSGSPYLVADNFFYTNGRDDRLTVIQRGCEQADNGDIDDILCSDCEVRINSFQTCTFCSLQTCDNGAQAPLIHCENIENGGAIFNLCETDSIKADGGVFDYFSSDEFQSCVDNSPANDICNEGVPLVLDGSSVFGSTELAINDNVPPCELASEGSGVWYRVEGTGKGILASTCSDNNFEFDSQLSIYSGSCEDLTCVAFNDDTPREDCPFGHHSSVAWFGEEGVVYHIKVHGYSLSRGEFEFYVKEVDWAIESCASKKASGEFSGFDETSTVSCNCAVAFEDSQELSCMSTCVYCHSEGEVCATQSSGGIYDPNEPFHTSYVEYKYTEGRNEVIRMNDFGCDSSGCTTCRVAVDGKRCNSCQNVDCTDQFGNIIGRGRKVDCSNVEPNAVFDECENPLTIESGIFEVLSSNEFTQCKQDPLDACQGLATAFEESGADLGTICSCEADGQDAILSCSEPDCHYCNTETSVCASLDYGGRISGDLGEITTTFNEYKYFEGRSESLRYEAADGRCVFTIDGTACSSCEQVICSTSLGAYQGVTVDCENIEEGASYNACTQDKVDSGVLELLSHQEFDACLDAEGNAESVCSERKVLEENKGEELGLGTTCECVSKAITGDHTLTCTDSSCIFCNYESLVCATNIFGVHYGRFGQEVSTFDGFQYTEGGRNEEVVLTNADGQCRVTVDDSECTSCESIVCIDEGTGNPFPGVDVKCENVPDGGNLSGCDRIFVDTGVLEVATDSEFSVCIKPRSSVESCILEIDDYKASLSADEDPICECTENEHGGHSMTCVEKGCLYCNSEKSVCGYNVVGKHFGRLGQVMGSFNGFQYIEGREDTVIFAQVQDPSDSRDCVVSAGDKECASCSLVSCGIFTGISVECENIEEGGSFNTCGESLVDSGVLEYFSFREFLECIQVRDPIEYCEQQKDFYELINPDAGTVCTCEAMGDEAKLSCADTGCQYCNLDESACNVKVAYGANISRLGYFQSTFDVRHYVVGRTERVVLHQTPSSACRVMVDDQECETCEIEVCGDGSQSYVIGCENVDDKYRLSGCSDFGNGIFAHLKATDGFGICVAYDGTFPPTSTPTIAPTSVSEDPDTTGGETGDGSSEGRQNQFTSWWFYTSILLQVVVLTS